MLDASILCLVTDRRRLASRLGLPDSAVITALLEQIAGAVQGGIDLVQIRERDIDGGFLASLVREAVGLTAGSRTSVMVNDRLDVALVAGAQGVHLREDSLPAGDVRRLTPAGFLVSRSIHTRESLERSGPVDLFIAGTAFRTLSKPGHEPLLGTEGLRQLARATERPVLAIGGVTESTVPDVARAGAAGVAAIGAFLPPPGSRNIVNDVQILSERLRFAFDSAGDSSLN